MKMRELIDLVEGRTTLPLYKDAANVTYNGRQPSLIVVMSPQAFLRLTTSERQYQGFLTHDPAEGRPDSLEGTQYAMPYLRVDPHGKVTEHDGRHRAAVVARAGGNRFPVAMIFDDPHQTTLPPKLFSQFMAGVSVPTTDMKAAPPKPLRPMAKAKSTPELAAKANAILARWRNSSL